MTVTSAEAEELIGLAREHVRMLTVFQNRRWDGDFMTVRKVLQNGWLGKLVEFEAHFDRYRSEIADSWKEKAGPGSWVLYNLGSHMLDQVLVLFGMPEYLDARMGIQRPNGETDDFYDIRLQYPDFQVIVKSSYLVREPGPRYILHGTHGSFIKYGIDPQEQDLKEKKIPGIAGWGEEPQAHWGKLNTTIDGLHFCGNIETIPGNYLAFYDNVYDVICHGKSLAVRPEESQRVIRLIELCAESNRLKKAIKIE